MGKNMMPRFTFSDFPQPQSFIGRTVERINADGTRDLLYSDGLTWTQVDGGGVGGPSSFAALTGNPTDNAPLAAALAAGGILGPYASAAALQTAYPAGTAGRRAAVGAAAPYVTYSDNGSAWVPLAPAVLDSNGRAVALVEPVASRPLYPSVQILTQWQMKKWRAALAKQMQGGARAKIAFIGDSTFTGGLGLGVSSWANNRQFAMADLVAARLAARGFAVNVNNTFADNNTSSAGTSLPLDPRVSLTSGWVFSGLGAAGWSIGGNWPSNFSNGNRYSFLPGSAFDAIEAFYIERAVYGGLSIAVDGGAAIGASVDTAAGGDTKLVRMASRTTTLGTHTVDIFKTTAGDSKSILLVGINTYDSTAPKIECYNWAVGSSRVGDWATTTNAYNLGSCVTNPVFDTDLSIISLTINDANNATSVASYKANLQTLVTARQASGSVLLVSSTPIGTANGLANQPGLVQAASEVAAACGVPFVDTYSRWESESAANALGWMTHAVDTIHPNRYGLQDVANAVIPFIAP